MSEKPTTTCYHCGNDFHDADMMPLPQGGELCGDCLDRLRDSAPALLAALEELYAAIPVFSILPGLADRVDAALAAAKGKE